MPRVGDFSHVAKGLTGCGSKEATDSRQRVQGQLAHSDQFALKDQAANSDAVLINYEF
jgi:hypothetical protein